MTFDDLLFLIRYWHLMISLERLHQLPAAHNQTQTKPLWSFSVFCDVTNSDLSP